MPDDNHTRAAAARALAAESLMRRAVDIANTALASLPASQGRADLLDALVGTMQDARGLLPLHQLPGASTLSCWVDDRAMQVAAGFIATQLQGPGARQPGQLTANLQVAVADAMLLAAARALAGPPAHDQGGR